MNLLVHQIKLDIYVSPFHGLVDVYPTRFRGCRLQRQDHECSDQELGGEREGPAREHFEGQNSLFTKPMQWLCHPTPTPTSIFIEDKKPNPLACIRAAAQPGTTKRNSLPPKERHSSAQRRQIDAKKIISVLVLDHSFHSLYFTLHAVLQLLDSPSPGCIVR
jgi:hypothetical protein